MQKKWTLEIIFSLYRVLVSTVLPKDSPLDPWVPTIWVPNCRIQLLAWGTATGGAQTQWQAPGQPPGTQAPTPRPPSRATRQSSPRLDPPNQIVNLHFQDISRFETSRNFSTEQPKSMCNFWTKIHSFIVEMSPVLASIQRQISPSFFVAISSELRLLTISKFRWKSCC